MAFRNRRNRYSSRPSRFLAISFLLLAVAGGVASYIIFFEGEKPVITLEQTRSYIGKEAVVNYTVTDNKSGLRSINVWGTQGELKELLHSQTFPRLTYTGTVGPLIDSQKIVFNATKKDLKKVQ